RRSSGRRIAIVEIRGANSANTRIYDVETRVSNWRGSVVLTLRNKRPLSPRSDGVDGSRSRHQSAKAWKRSSNHERREPPAMEITTIGLDLAKNVYQVHAINGAGEVVVRKTIRRAQVLRFFERLDPCLVGIEACGTSHYWAREISTFGHEVRLMPPAYVKPYVKRGKTDAS